MKPNIKAVHTRRLYCTSLRPSLRLLRSCKWNWMGMAWEDVKVGFADTSCCLSNLLINPVWRGTLRAGVRIRTVVPLVSCLLGVILFFFTSKVCMAEIFSSLSDGRHNLCVSLSPFVSNHSKGRMAFFLIQPFIMEGTIEVIEFCKIFSTFTLFLGSKWRQHNSQRHTVLFLFHRLSYYLVFVVYTWFPCFVDSAESFSLVFEGLRCTTTEKECN